MKLGYTILYVPDVAQSVAFYQKAFGLTCRFISAEGDYAEMETGSATLAFASEELAESHGFEFTKNRADAAPAGVEICLICDDVPAAYAAAVAAQLADLCSLTAMTSRTWIQWFYEGQLAMSCRRLDYSPTRAF